MKRAFLTAFPEKIGGFRSVLPFRRRRTDETQPFPNFYGIAIAAGALLLALLFTAGAAVAADGARASAPAASAQAAEPAASSRAAQTVSAASASEPSAPFSEAELESVAEHGTLQIASGLCERLWVPKAPGATARQVAAWLRQARPYTGKIPETQISPYAFKANVAPASLSVSASGGYSLSVQAAFYFVRLQGAAFQERFVPDVLALRANGKTSFLRCAPLYGFLQNGGWEPGFRLKYGG